jgi:hypothetical protein
MTLPLSVGNRFIVGLNEGWFKYEYDHDIGRNQFSAAKVHERSLEELSLPDETPWEPFITNNRNEVTNFFIQNQSPEKNVMVVRIWAFERFEGLQFDDDGFVIGIDEEHLASNMERVFDTALEHGMQVYLCINAWAIFDNKDDAKYNVIQQVWKRNLRLLLKDASAREKFITNALIPLIRIFENHAALFAVDLLNEPENILDNEREDLTVSEETKVNEKDLDDFIIACSRAIRAHFGSVKFSCGFMRDSGAKRFAKLAGRHLDFFDFHIYENDGKIPPYKSSDFAGKPCILGECGAHAKDHAAQYVSAKVVSAAKNMMSNAQNSGYAGCLLWRIEDYFDNDNSREPLRKALQDFADTKPLIVKEKGTGPGCFIATAAMGSELHPHVQFLREYRDTVILKSRYRRRFEDILEFYYRFSPPIARSMEKYKILKLLLRYTVVSPLVFSLMLLVKLFQQIRLS